MNKYGNAANWQQLKTKWIIECFRFEALANGVSLYLHNTKMMNTPRNKPTADMLRETIEVGREKVGKIYL